jgi:hypothetical protein
VNFIEFDTRYVDLIFKEILILIPIPKKSPILIVTLGFILNSTYDNTNQVSVKYFSKQDSMTQIFSQIFVEKKTSNLLIKRFLWKRKSSKVLFRGCSQRMSSKICMEIVWPPSLPPFCLTSFVLLCLLIPYKLQHIPPPWKMSYVNSPLDSDRTFSLKNSENENCMRFSIGIGKFLSLVKEFL